MSRKASVGRGQGGPCLTDTALAAAPDAVVRGCCRLRQGPNAAPAIVAARLIRWRHASPRVTRPGRRTERPSGSPTPQACSSRARPSTRRCDEGASSTSLHITHRHHRTAYGTAARRARRPVDIATEKRAPRVGDSRRSPTDQTRPCLMPRGARSASSGPSA